MAPLILPCKCTEVVVPAKVKTNDYKVQASIEGCQVKGYCRFLHLCLPLPLEDQFYWNNCQCNEFDGLMRRHFLGRIVGFVPRNLAFLMLEKELFEMRSIIPTFTRVDHRTLMDNTRSTIKSRYRRAYNEWRNTVTNLGYKEKVIKAFVKYEKIPIGKYEAGKPPRMIQFRDFTYLYCLKRELLNFSITVKSNPGLSWNGQSICSIFTKVRDSYGTAAVLRESWDEFVDPVAICLDHSKFDGHYCSELLDLEKDFWTNLNPSRMLKWLLEQQKVNVGRTHHGIKYRVTGGRMSGEYTTSDGNTTMNYAMLSVWLKYHGLRPYEFRLHVNGDDSVIIVDRKYSWLATELNFFRNFNMETECDRVADDFRMISYCQANPIRVARDGELVWYMVKEPCRTISRMQYCDERYAGVITRYLRGVGLCELAVNSGVPITQAIAMWMIDIGDKPLGCVDKFPALNSGNSVQFRPVEAITREDYEVAFGISIEGQIAIESYFAGLIRSPQDLNAIISRYSDFHRR